MTTAVSLGEALPAAIAKVSEWIGQQEAQAKELDDLSPGAGEGTRFMANVVRVKRDVAVSAQQSGDVVAMIAAYQQIKPCLDLATAEQGTPVLCRSPYPRVILERR
jgi:phage-related minor tail protein